MREGGFQDLGKTLKKDYYRKYQRGFVEEFRSRQLQQRRLSLQAQ
jgi:hypothetical protein